MKIISSYGVELRKQNIPIRQTLEIYRYSSSFQFTSSRETTNAASLYSKCSTGYDFSGLV